MKYVNTIHGPVPAWRWNLKWRVLGALEQLKAIRCFLTRHAWIPDCGSWYCTRCHKWEDPDTEDQHE